MFINAFGFGLMCYFSYFGFVCCLLRVRGLLFALLACVDYLCRWFVLFGLVFV